MPLASSLLLTIVLFITLTVINMMTEARHKLSIVKMFGQYVPPELVDEMSQEPEKYQLKNTNRELTVLFSDIRSFTTISENLNPDELSELMNRYLTEMTAVIHKHQGTIDKYMGDAIMAFWGAPIKNPEHAKFAALAALLPAPFSRRGYGVRIAMAASIALFFRVLAFGIVSSAATAPAAIPLMYIIPLLVCAMAGAVLSGVPLEAKAFAGLNAIRAMIRHPRSGRRA